MSLDLIALMQFVIAAKRATYVGSGPSAEPSRLGAHDLRFDQGDWHYRDSYFGGTDFLGQEVVWFHSEPVWCMNYHGYIIRPDLIDATKAGSTLKAALSQPETQGRLLDNFVWSGPFGIFEIFSRGTIERFSGRETIVVGDIEAYALDYHGGLVRL